MKRIDAQNVVILPIMIDINYDYGCHTEIS